MTDLFTNPLLPGYLFAGFLLAAIVVLVAHAIQGLQED